MYRKLMIALCSAVLLSLLGSGPTFTSKGVPTWETAFDPGASFGDYYLFQALEEYKGELYAVAGDPGWFDFDSNNPRATSPGQIFRSPDGENWTPASDIGFGLGAPHDECGDNTYDTAWDMTVFKNKIYVLPFDFCYTRPGVILRSSDGTTWDSVATTEELGYIFNFGGLTSFYGQFHKFGVFKGMLYAGIDYYDDAAEFTAAAIVRSPTGDPGTWEKVIDFPGWGGPGSFHVFKGALYLASDWVYAPPDWIGLPEQIWRTYDGVTWEMVVGDGFGNPGDDSMGGFADYKGYLYVGEGIFKGNAAQIWRSKDGANWEPVALDGFGGPLDEKVDGLVVYQGNLYAYTDNWTDGGSVFRTKDAKTWERVSEPGWGNYTYATSHLESAQVVFKDDLYMGVVGPQGVVKKLTHPNK